MSIFDFFKIIFEGAIYDAFRLLLGSLIGTVVSVMAIRIISDKLRGKRDILAFSACMFMLFFLLLYFVGTQKNQPQLAGGIQNVVAIPVAGQDGTIAVIAMSIINTGNMQTIIKNWNVEASLNGNRYQGTISAMPERVVLQMPDLGVASPSFLTYHREDDILLKSIIPLQGGALVAGTLYVVFQGVDQNIFKAGADITVTYEDVFSKPYAAMIKMKAKSDPVGVIPGLHTEMVCRMPPGGLPQMSTKAPTGTN